MKRIACVAPALLVLASLAPRAARAADPTPMDLLKKVDASVSSANDQYIAYELSTVEPGKPDRIIVFEVTVKGPHWRRARFLAPADLRDTRLLVLSPTQSYIYLPAFRKVRRIASHVKEQGFMGSAYDNDEIALASYGGIFMATAAKDLGENYSLSLKLKPEQEFSYSRIDMVVRKDNYQPIELRYFNNADKHVKTERRMELDCQKGACAPRVMEMIDHARGDLKSRMTRKAWKTNQGIPDDFFTVRALQQGG